MVMRILNYRDFSVYYFGEKLPLWILGTIVDIETRSLNSETQKLSALGLVRGNRLIAYVLRLENERGAFLAWARKKVLKCPRPFISYNKKFEEDWLGIDFDVELQPRDMLPKRKAIKFYHIENTPNRMMISASAREIMYHLICDLLEELALYASLSHLYREKQFKVYYIDEEFSKLEED